MSISVSDPVAANYFDGQSASCVAVTLVRAGDELRLHGDALTQSWPLKQVRISERLGNTPRLLRFPDGGHCEVTDHAGLAALLGERPGWLEHAHHRLRWALLAGVLILMILGLGYRYLLPWAAERIAMNLPQAALQKLGGATLEALDGQVLQPSELSAQRQQAIRNQFFELESADAELPYRVEFRRSDLLGANAFALPDGSIVLLDGLVTLTSDDREVAAVLAHELGHVQRRHAVRILLQESVVGLVLAWYIGDVSTLLASAPGWLLDARYSREMEAEADRYAARLLDSHGWSPCLLGSMLDKLEAWQHSKAADPLRSSPLGKKSADYLASHPATAERKRAVCTDAN